MLFQATVKEVVDTVELVVKEVVLEVVSVVVLLLTWERGDLETRLSWVYRYTIYTYNHIYHILHHSIIVPCLIPILLILNYR